MHRLKCDVPRVMSAASSGSITPNTAPLMPLIACAAIGSHGPGNTASSSPRNGSAAQPSSRIGRRPSGAAPRPTEGEHSATTICGTMMQAAMIRLAKLPARIVTAAPTSGSIAAFDRWNSSTQTANVSSRRSANNRRSPGQSNGGIVVCSPRMRAAADRQQRQQRRNAQGRGQQEHRLAGQVGAGRAHHRGGESIADRGEARVTPKPFAERRVPDQMQADRGDRGGEHATRERVQRSARLAQAIR